MGTFFSVIVGCLSIGVLLSAPMGPIGILCVQRTLSNGRMSGFYTGVGAALSDLFYCLLTGLGISMVIDFIEDNVSVLQVVGSALLIAYAVYMIVHDPLKKMTSTTSPGGDLKRDMLTGFFLTLGNPLIVLLIIPLFARFSFPLPEYSWIIILFGYLMIVVGALLWWAVITFGVDKVRSQFSMGSVRVMNRVMGAILLVVSLYGLATGVWECLHIYKVL